MFDFEKLALYFLKFLNYSDIFVRLRAVVPEPFRRAVQSEFFYGKQILYLPEGLHVFRMKKPVPLRIAGRLNLEGKRVAPETHGALRLSEFPGDFSYGIKQFFHKLLIH